MPLRVLRYLDLVVLALALPIFVAAGLPLLGWAGAAGGWLLQRVIQYFIEKRARESDDPRTVAGLLTGSMIARGWIVAGSHLRRRADRARGGPCCGDPFHHPLHLLLHQPDAHAAVRRRGGAVTTAEASAPATGAQPPTGEERTGLSTRPRSCIGLGIYLGVAVLLYVIFGVTARTPSSSLRRSSSSSRGSS